MRFFSIVAALTFALCRPAFAEPQDCFVAAGQHFGIAPALLRAIAEVESSLNPAALHVNPGGSEDIGIMQVNSGWLPALGRFGITRSTLLDDPCTNIHVGAWILKRAIQERGYNWRAVGAYNSPDHEKAIAYARRVWAAYLSNRRLGR